MENLLRLFVKNKIHINTNGNAIEIVMDGILKCNISHWFLYHITRSFWESNCLLQLESVEDANNWKTLC